MNAPYEIGRLATVSAPAHRHLGADVSKPEWGPMRDTLFDLMSEHDVKCHVSIAAPGLDQLAASVAGWLEIEHEIVRPFPDHERTWPAEQADRARNLVDTATNVITVSQTPSRFAVGLAYKTVVERADALFAIDADDSVTVAHAIENARIREIPVFLSRGDDVSAGRYVTIWPDEKRDGDEPWDA